MIDAIKDLDDFKMSWIGAMRILTGIEDTDYLNSAFATKFMNKEIEIYSSVTGKTKVHLAMDLLNKIKNDYVIVENGALFLKHEIFTAPAVITYGILKKLRSYYKTEMKKAKGSGKPVETAFYNLMQGNTKEALNTFYGIMINIFSKYYNYDIASATTVRGRSTVSMNGLTIESHFGSYRAYNVSIHMNFIHQASSKKVDWSYYDDILILPTDEMILKHILRHHYEDSYYGLDILKNRISKLTDRERKLVYYTSNFDAIIHLPYVQKLIASLLKDQNDKYSELNKLMEEKEYGKFKKIVYLDPMECPEYIKDRIDELSLIMKEILYGFYWYEGDVNEYGERLDSTEDIFKNIERERIIVTDTDSLILTLQEDMNKIKEIPNYKEVTSHLDPEMLDYIVGSIIINAVSTIVATGLWRYTTQSNIPETYRHMISYKQEFFFSTLQVTKGAKNYLGYIAIQEGVFLPSKEPDLKGLSLKKGNFNKALADKAKEIALNMIAEKKIPDIRDILNKIDNNRKELVELFKGKDNIQVFTITKYKKGFDDLYDYEKGNDRIKACNVYEAIYGEKIHIPGSFLIASISFKGKLEDLEEGYPEQFQKLTEYANKRAFEANLLKLLSRFRKLQGKDKKEEINWGALPMPLYNGYKSIIEYMKNGVDFSILKEYWTKLKQEVKNKQEWYDVVNFTLDKPNIEDITKIAIPLDSNDVDEFITDFISIDDITIFENLSAVIVEGLGLTVVRNNINRQVLTNVISYF